MKRRVGTSKRNDSAGLPASYGAAKRIVKARRHFHLPLIPDHPTLNDLDAI